MTDVLLCHCKEVGCVVHRAACECCVLQKEKEAVAEQQVQEQRHEQSKRRAKLEAGFSQVSFPPVPTSPAATKPLLATQPLTLTSL